MSCPNPAQPNSGRKYFLPDEVVIRNDASSAWVIVHESVIDVTPLFRAARNKEPLRKNLRWLLALAGQDLSEHFHPDRTPIERAGERVPTFPPSLERNPATGLPWWRDASLAIGRLTFRPCPVKIINALTFRATEMVVCYEDTIAAVRDKFRRYNDNAAQYEWRKDTAFGHEEGKLRLDWTLAQNGYRIERQFRPVSVIWIFYILPVDEQADCAAPASGEEAPGKVGEVRANELSPRPVHGRK